MEYVAVQARFLFFNGKKNYTVEYSYGLHKWYVFNEEETSNAIYQKENKNGKGQINEGRIGKFEAEEILQEYLNKQSHVPTHP